MGSIRDAQDEAARAYRRPERHLNAGRVSLAVEDYIAGGAGACPSVLAGPLVSAAMLQQVLDHVGTPANTVAVAGHPNASDALMMSLVVHPRSAVRWALVSNPNVPAQALGILAHDRIAAVAGLAIGAIARLVTDISRTPVNARGFDALLEQPWWEYDTRELLAVASGKVARP